MARYLLKRLSEKYGIDVEYHCKPLGGDRLERLRHAREFLHQPTCAKTAARHISRRSWRRSRSHKDEHIAVYGPDNHMRLTGLHETQSIDKFNYGVADRGASVRVPHSFIKNDYKGYLEDRRPNSQGDPYQIASQILKTIESVPKEGLKSVAA